MDKRIFINYETSGMCVCGDTAGTKETIKLTIIEVEPGKTYNTIGKVEVTRYPSDTRLLNFKRREDGYSMAVLMSCDKDCQADIIAQEMDLYDPCPMEPVNRVLKDNDLYVIKSMFITKRKRDKGYGTYVLCHLQDVLKRISNDSRPVIAVVPHAFENPADTDRVVRFFESNDFKKAHNLAQTMLKY